MSSIKNISNYLPVVDPIVQGEGVDMPKTPLFSETVGEISSLQGKTVQVLDPFLALRLNSNDKQNIQDLITTLDKRSYLELLFYKKDMDRKGDKVKVVHPLRFIGYILQSVDLKHRLKSIMKDSIKGSQFISNFVNRMGEFAAKEDLQVYAEGFANILEVPLATVQDILSSRRYADVVNKFI